MKSAEYASLAIFAGLIALALSSLPSASSPSREYIAVNLTPKPDTAPPICVCDVNGSAWCHWPDGIAQALPRSMCVGKQPGDNPISQRKE